MEKRLNDWLDSLEKMAEKGGDFLGEQIPLLVQESLAWEFWYAIFALAALLPLGIAAFALFWRTKETIKDFGDEPASFIPFFAFIATGICLAFSIGNAHNAVKVKVAPRVVIVEQLRGMVKK